MACATEGNGIFLCQETVDFWVGRLTPVLSPETAAALRADPLPLELVLFALIAAAATINLAVFGSRHRHWRWWRHD